MIAAVGLAHHAVLVVAELGGAQPQRAAFLVGVAGCDQLARRLVDLALGIERGFEVVDVEADAERLEIGVLLAAQIRDREAADRVEVVGVAVADDILAVRVHALACEIRARDILDVFAAVAVRRPARCSSGPMPRQRACTDSARLLICAPASL